MNIYQLYGKIGPWATPAPAALALAGRLYGEWASINQLTAWGIAVFSLVALEVVGGLCSYQAIRTSLSRQWGWFAICLLGVFTYVGLGVYALWGLTAWIYVVLAVFVHVAVAAELTAGQARSEVVEDRAYILQEREAELKAAKEITAQVRAEARKAKAAQLDSQLQASLSQLEPATSQLRASYECPCGKSFSTVQALNAHKRVHK